MFARLAQRPAVVLGFYGLSGLVLTAFGVGFYFTFGGSPPVFLLAGVPLLVLSWMLYARLLGRLAFVLMFTKAWWGSAG